MAPLAEPFQPGCPGGLRDSYEALREAVLGGRPEGFRHGQAVLAGQGMAAWITTWSALAPPGAGTTADPSDPPTRTLSDPTTQLPTINLLSSRPDAGQVVAVLAQMALAHA